MSIMANTNSVPLPSSSSTQSTTTTTTTKNQDEEENGCLVYWDDHQHHHKLIDQVNHPIPKRNSALAGIPSPSKPASERDQKEPIDSLNLRPSNQNNHRASRLNKRRKSKPQTDAELPESKLSKPQSTSFLPKQKAWQELANRLSSRKKRESTSSICPEETNPMPPPNPETRETTSNNPSNPTDKPKSDVIADNLQRRVFGSSSSATTSQVPDLKTHNQPRTSTSNQPLHPQTTITKSNQPATKPIIPTNRPANNAHPKNPIQDRSHAKFTSTTVASVPSSSQQNSHAHHHAHTRNQIKSDETCQPVADGSSSSKSTKLGLDEPPRTTCGSSKKTSEQAGEGCEPWEMEEDDEFGSQLLELADLVEKEQRMSQEISDGPGRNRESLQTTTTVTPQTTPWKLVENRKKSGPSSVLGVSKSTPTVTTHSPLLPSKTHVPSMHRAPPSGPLKQSPIIYKTAVVSKASLSTVSKSNPSLNKSVVRGVMGNTKKPTEGPTTIRPKKVIGATNDQSSIPVQKLSYPDALLRTRPSSLNILPKIHPPPISLRKSSLSILSRPSAQHDLESLFSGIDANDLDWDPNDQ